MDEDIGLEHNLYPWLDDPAPWDEEFQESPCEYCDGGECEYCQL